MVMVMVMEMAMMLVMMVMVTMVVMKAKSFYLPYNFNDEVDEDDKLPLLPNPDLWW